MKTKFPHIYRIIPSLALFVSLVLKTLLISIFLAMVFLNLNSLLFPENLEYSTLKINMLKNPYDYNNFMVMAKYLNKINMDQESKAYFLKAQNLYQSAKVKPRLNNVLGESTVPINVYNQILEEKGYYKEQLEYWLNIGKQINLRDAYIQSSYYANKLDYKNEAIQYLQKAIEIDPLINTRTL